MGHRRAERHWPDVEFLDVALGAVRTEEREGYIERLEAFVEQHRARLEELLRAYGPGSRPASHGRYALIGRPETLVILERMETNPFGLRAQGEKELEDVFLGDLEFAWGRASASAGEQPGTSGGAWQGDPVRPRCRRSAEVERLLCEVGRGRAGQGRAVRRPGARLPALDQLVLPALLRGPRHAPLGELGTCPRPLGRLGGFDLFGRRQDG